MGFGMRPRYTTKTRLRAVELRKVGWTYPKIREILSAEGVNPAPSDNAIRRWAYPAHLAKRQAYDKDYRRRRRLDKGYSFLLAGKSDEYRTALVQRLDQEGVPVAEIGKVCTVVLGADLTDDELWAAIDGVAA